MSPTLAVISQTGESLSFYDIESGTLTTRITNLTSEPHELCYDAKRKLLYISHTYRHGHYWSHGTYSHEISIVDTNTKSVIDIINTSPAHGPHGLYLDSAHDILYASVEELDPSGGGVIGIDLTTRKTVKSVPSHYSSHWFVMTPDAKKAYCCNKTASFISVLDLEKEELVKKIDVPGGTEEPSVSVDGRYVFFPTPGYRFGKNPEESRILVIDTETDAVVEEIRMKLGSLPVHVSPMGTILAGQYFFGDPLADPLKSANQAVLAVFDAESHELVGEVAVGLMPLTIRCSVDGRLAFVANAFEGTVSVVDLVELKLVRTIVVDGQRKEGKNIHVGAHGMAYID